VRRAVRYARGFFPVALPTEEELSDLNLRCRVAAGALGNSSSVHSCSVLLYRRCQLARHRRALAPVPDLLARDSPPWSSNRLSTSTTGAVGRLLPTRRPQGRRVDGALVPSPLSHAHQCPVVCRAVVHGTRGLSTAGQIAPGAAAPRLLGGRCRAWARGATVEGLALASRQPSWPRPRRPWWF